MIPSIKLFFSSVRFLSPLAESLLCTMYRFVTVSSVIVFTACNSTSSKPAPGTNNIAIIDLPSPIPLSKAEVERLRNACEAWYDTVLKSTGFNGGMLVAKNGNIIFEAYNGTGHINGRDTISRNTPFHIASVSKTFTAMAVLKLWQDGKLNIDDELKKYFPQFNYPGVTIRTLLDHRSGLPNYIYFMESLGWDKTKFVTNEDIFNYLVNRKAELTNIGTANTHFSYCNTNYALLALLVEKISGKKFPDFMQQTFFTPLQMKNTSVFNTNNTFNANPSYDWRGRLIPLNFLDAVYGDKNIYTTPEDLLTWDRALTSGKIFTQQVLVQAYTPYSNEKHGIRNYGLGWRMNIYPDAKKIIYHNGWWHGSNAAFIRMLSDSATIIVIGNKFNRGIYHAKDLTNIFGDYYSPEEDEETENTKPADNILPIGTDKLPHKKTAVTKKLKRRVK